ncbi:hypothetical protein RLQ00_001640 [Salmonella enterica]|uniref:hypothetical protein n=1 Tax=Citrobacter freundii TaxID=546 RepID=UPI0014148B69|nr:hypothetical protein [Citrobacter freundii]EAZ5991674.1 hypothetical protein [Salmonella enterica]EBY2261594.1 hypothetical protein [Salmonella enterica subsp. enterica serovar Newport]EBJ0730101.1 hypothetical protein [Salmonella enterica]ECO6783080.1 hypothetical protein [Salmonella enterica]EDQ5368729.1 hypothetical protein [Salmonella enterica]
MKKSKAISKLERILIKIRNFDFDESDIELLFITARALPNATKSIFEIGSFVAHGDVRDQGLINDIMLRNQLLINCVLGKDKKIVDVNKNQYPKYLPKLLELQLKLYTDEYFKDKLDLKGGQIQKARAVLNKKSSFVIDGDYCRLTDKVGANELNMINCALSKLHANDGIDYDDLMLELVGILKADIEFELLSLLEGNKKEIFCCLLLLLNQVVFSLRKDVSAKTVITVDEKELVSICGWYPVENENGYDNSVVSPVFSSKYLASEILESNVTGVDLEKNDIEFSKELKKIVKRNESYKK